jgi:hypothetical protein
MRETENVEKWYRKCRKRPRRGIEIGSMNRTNNFKTLNYLKIRCLRGSSFYGINRREICGLYKGKDSGLGDHSFSDFYWK